jgi:HEAT repeat protein
LNSVGYGIQQEIILKRQKERVFFYKNWIETLSASVGEDPMYAEAWTNLGWAYHTVGDLEKARGAFKKALALKPDLIDANMGMAYVLRDSEQDFQKAVEYMKRASDANPSLTWTKKEMGSLLAHVREPEGPEALLKEARSGERSARLRAIKKLGELRDSSALPLLGESAGDTDKDVRYAAIDAIKSIGGEEAIPHLRNAMINTEKKWEIVTAILAIREDAALPYLIEMLQTGDNSEKVAEFIGQRRLNTLFPVLLEVIENRLTPAPAMVRALGEMGDARAIPLLRKILNKSRDITRTEAALSLALLNAQEALDDIRSKEKLIRNSFDKSAFIIARTALGDKEARQQLKDILSGKNKKLISYTEKTMGRMGPRLRGIEFESLP